QSLTSIFDWSLRYHLTGTSKILFYILERAEEHCKMVKHDKHKQAILAKIRSIWFVSLAEINQRYESNIRDFVRVIEERSASEHLKKEMMTSKFANIRNRIESLYLLPLESITYES